MDRPTFNPARSGAGNQVAGAGMGAMAGLVFMLWPQPAGQEWTPAAQGAVVAGLGFVGWLFAPAVLRLRRWMGGHGGAPMAVAILALMLGGCGAARNNSALLGGQGCGGGDAGGQSDCTALGDDGSRVYLEGGSGSFDPATKVVTWDGADLVEITHGPAAVTTVQGQAAVGDALNNAVDVLGAIAQEGRQNPGASQPTATAPLPERAPPLPEDTPDADRLAHGDSGGP